MTLFASQPIHAAWVDIELGSGTIGPAVFVLSEFEVPAAVGAGGALVISSAGSGFDTEIAVYDANGRLLATNDDARAGTRISEIGFGASRPLPAGRYFAALTGFNAFFGDNSIDAGSSRGGAFRLTASGSAPVLTLGSPIHGTADGLMLPGSIREFSLMRGFLRPHEIRRIDFRLERDITPADWFAIHTAGSGFDTEIGLYDSVGSLVASNDDVNPDNGASRLSFGLDGDSGRSLPAGLYSVLLGGFNTLFAPGFSATSSWTRGGDYQVYLQTSVGVVMPDALSAAVRQPLGEPSSLWLALAGMSIGLRRSKAVVAVANTLFRI